MLSNVLLLLLLLLLFIYLRGRV